MGRLIVALSLALAVAAQDEHFRKAGACGRCHVISVVEWGISKHARVETGCETCHGKSEGHVVDERNNIKPERIPRGAAVAGLCGDCHGAGCPKTRKTAECGTCHHFHALVDPAKPAVARDEQFERRSAEWREADRRIAEGGKLASQERWKDAREAFAAALRLRPHDTAARDGVKRCEARLRPVRPGFEILGPERDAATGLPLRVRAGGLEMVLVPGGEADIGSDRRPASAPVHTVRVEPFYLGKCEVTRGEWAAVMGGAPAGEARLPASSISWEDAQAFVRKLNERTAGGGFRLPGEAEWEYAARAGGGGMESAWFGRAEPRAAGAGAPDRLGFHDLLGNVWEWCSSLAAPYPYDAADGREAAGPGLRVLRGGGYTDPADLLDPALRHGERPSRRLPGNGLRVAREAW